MLRDHPRHADAHFLLGIADAASGRFTRGLEAIDRALALAPERAEYHAQKARCLATLRRDREALAAAERTFSLEPGDALTYDTVGVVLTQLGAHERAAVAFRRAVEMRPDRADFHYNLGTSLRFIGDFAGAEAAFEQSIRLDPRLYKAHSALADLRPQRAEHNHVERLRALLAEVGDDVDGELHLRHALAKELEDLGEHEASFAQLSAGKMRKRAAVRYSFDADRALFERVEAVCSESLLARGAAGDPSGEPIFVVGMPRTGTTLVERILASHSLVLAAGELPNFGLCVKRASGTRSSRVLDPETVAAAAGIDFAALGKRYLDSTRLLTGRTPRFVDKMPLNFFYVGFIALALPNAKIVCVRRNPLDTCLANYRQLFATGFSYYHYAYDLADVGRYYIAFDRLIGHWRRLLAGRLHELRYEALVADPRAETGRLLVHLDLEWQESCLDFHRNTAPVATASAMQVREPLHARSIGRWRRYAGELEPLMAELLAAGIELEEASPGPASGDR